MKKTLLSITALTLSLLAYSQEADLGNSGAELIFIPRLDLNPTLTDGEVGFNHGNSSIYTLFYGSASEHLSWTLGNHWISAGGNYGWPYKNLGYSWSSNWVDFCKVDLIFGNWDFTLGKDCIATGGFEFDKYDWEAHYELQSPLWWSLSSYQWGGTVGYTTNSGMSTFSLQMSSSPFGEHPFSSGLWNYSAKWSGEYGWFSNRWSVSALEREKGVYDMLWCIGNRATFGDWQFTLDWANTPGINEDETSLGGGYFINGKVEYAFSDKFETALNAIFVNHIDGYSGLNSVGALVHYYPLSDENLRIHAYAAYQPEIKCFTLGVGARWYLRLRVW